MHNNVDELKKSTGITEEQKLIIETLERQRKEQDLKLARLVHAENALHEAVDLKMKISSLTTKIRHLEQNITEE